MATVIPLQVDIIDEQGKVKKVVAAHDADKAFNPVNIEGKIEGRGADWALLCGIRFRF